MQFYSQSLLHYVSLSGKSSKGVLFELPGVSKNVGRFIFSFFPPRQPTQVLLYLLLFEFSRMYLLPRIFTKEELLMIDSDEETVRKYLKKKEAIKKRMAKDEEMGGKKLDDDDDDVDKRGATSKTVDHTTTTTDNDGGSNEEDDGNDVVLGLPTTQDMNKEKRNQRRRNRKKSISCPENMLFVEALEAVQEEVEAAEAAAATDGTLLADDHSETTGSESASDDGLAAVGGIVPLEERITMRRRTRRSKTLSCPTHMLFAEADRHMNSNYFFG